MTNKKSERSPLGARGDGLGPALSNAAQNDSKVSTKERLLIEAQGAKRMAERYRLDYVDMDRFHIDQELFRSIPADLMLRYNFVPQRREGEELVIVVADPTDLPKLDELSLLLDTPLTVTVGTLSAIESKS